LSRRVLSGAGVSPGVGVGRCLLVKEEKRETAEKRGSASKPNASEETARFKLASDRVKKELQEIKAKIDRDAGKDVGAVFEAQLLILEDPLFVGDVNRRILAKALTAEEAVKQAIDSLKKRFSFLTSDYMRERGEDVRDVGLRVLDALKGKQTVSALMEKTKTAESKKVVIVSDNLAPSTVAQFSRNMLAGIVTETGGPTSHLAIVAKSLIIPAVFKVNGATKQLAEKEVLVVDGGKGRVIASPSKLEVSKYLRDVISPVFAPSPSVRSIVTSGPTQTRDRRSVQIFANVSDLEGLRNALNGGAEGIGLFRTEFLYLGRSAPPSEDELVDIMKQIVSIMPGKTIVVRTLDIGGDKKPDYVEFPLEKNPALGLRGTRFSLSNPLLFKTQISAILRANKAGQLRIMFPMISTMTEVKGAKRLMDEVKNELSERGCSFNTNTKVGVMIETPSAALQSDKLAKEVDFFSIGTNDLVQYTLAADRENENLVSIADPLEPSVLRLIQQTIINAHLSKRPVGMCGEMAADIEAIPILLGMGLVEFSVDPSKLQVVRTTIGSLSYEETTETIDDILAMESAKQVREYSRRKFKQPAIGPSH